jgi:hypothetical protein
MHVHGITYSSVPAAGIPSAMVQLIISIAHREPVNHLHAGRYMYGLIMVDFNSISKTATVCDIACSGACQYVLNMCTPRCA